MRRGGHLIPCIRKNTKDGGWDFKTTLWLLLRAYGASPWEVCYGSSSGRHPLATTQLLGGDCVGICNMLMCKVKKKKNPIPQESPAYVKYIVSLSQSIYQPAECQLNCTGWCRYMVGCWCQTLLQLSFSGIVNSTQWNGRHTKAKLNVLEIMSLKRTKCHSLAEKNVKPNVGS